jgi:hypothetical protein
LKKEKKKLDENLSNKKKSYLNAKMTFDEIRAKKLLTDQCKHRFNKFWRNMRYLQLLTMVVILMGFLLAPTEQKYVYLNKFEQWPIYQRSLALIHSKQNITKTSTHSIKILPGSLPWQLSAHHGTL